MATEARAVETTEEVPRAEVLHRLQRLHRPAVLRQVEALEQVALEVRVDMVREVMDKEDMGKEVATEETVKDMEGVATEVEATVVAMEVV